MDELLKTLQAKTGLGVDQLKPVIDGVVEFLGDKLPGPLGAQLKGLLGGDAAAGDAAAAAEESGGGLLDMAKDMLTGGDDADGGGGLLDKAKDILGGLTGKGDSPGR